MDSGSPDSGYNGVDELSYLDIDIAESSISENSEKISEDSPSPRFDYVNSDILPTDSLEVTGTREEGGRPWNIHFLSSLVLLVLFGACGFGLLLTSRSVLTPGPTSRCWIPQE